MALGKLQPLTFQSISLTAQKYSGLYTVVPVDSKDRYSAGRSSVLKQNSRRQTTTTTPTSYYWTMAQGGKFKSGGGASSAKQKRKSVASVKKQQRKQAQTSSKGRRTIQAKGRKLVESRGIQNATKAINKKNEILASAKAVAAGNTFFLNEIKEKGKKEINRSNQSKLKKETGSNKLSSRLKKQLRKMGRDV